VCRWPTRKHCFPPTPPHVSDVARRTSDVIRLYMCVVGRRCFDVSLLPKRFVSSEIDPIHHWGVGQRESICTVVDATTIIIMIYISVNLSLARRDHDDDHDHDSNDDSIRAMWPRGRWERNVTSGCGETRFWFSTKRVFGDDTHPIRSMARWNFAPPDPSSVVLSAATSPPHPAPSHDYSNSPTLTTSEKTRARNRNADVSMLGGSPKT
jgi:hypothetical protein